MKRALLQGTLSKSSKLDDSEDIFIEGIMSTPVVDLENEIIGRESYPDAINTIKKRKEEGRPIPIFVEHRKREFSLPVGTLDEAREAEGGLWFRARIVGGPSGSYLNTVQRLIEAGALYGCSIGGDALKSQMMYDSAKQAHIRKITKMDFRELSLTGLPVNQGSSFKIAKSLSGKGNSKKTAWQKEVNSLYKSLDNIIDSQIGSNKKNKKIQKSIESLDEITKSLENSIEKGEDVDNTNILDKIKGALTDLADLLGIQDLVSPSEGDGMINPGFDDEAEGEVGGENTSEQMEVPVSTEEGEDEEEEEIASAEEDLMDEGNDENTNEDVEEMDVEDEGDVEEMGVEDEGSVEEMDVEDEGDVEDEDVEDEDEDEDVEDEDEDVEDEDVEDEDEDVDVEEVDVENEGEELTMSDNVEDIELKLDKIIQLLSKKNKGDNKIVKNKNTKKEKSIGGETMSNNENTPQGIKKIEKAQGEVGVRGEQATTPNGAQVIASEHPHTGEQVGSGKENFDIGVAENPGGAQVEIGQKSSNKDDSNKSGNDNIAVANSPTASTVMNSKHPHSVFKCSNDKCGKEFAKSENFDPNFCAICGSEVDKYIYATDEQIQVLKDLEILQDVPDDNTGYSVSEYHGEEANYVSDKMKEVTEKEGNDLKDHSNNRNIQVGGKEVDGYGHDGHDFDNNGDFKTFLRGADNAYANKYSDGGKPYNGPTGTPDSKPYVGYTMKSEEVELDIGTKNRLEKSLIDGLLQHTSNLMAQGNKEIFEKINNVEKAVQEMKSQPIKKSFQTSEEIQKSQASKEKVADQTWVQAFGFGKQ